MKQDIQDKVPWQERPIGGWGQLLILFIFFFVFPFTMITIIQWVVDTGLDRETTLIGHAIENACFVKDMIFGIPGFINKLLHNIY